MFKWFHKLKIAQKLTLISVFFMIPDSIMLYLFITSINQNIVSAKLELTGNEYQRALEPLLKMIPEHRLLTRPGATPDARAAAGGLRGKIDAAFVELTATDAKIGTQLDFTEAGLAKRDRQGCDVASVRRAWEALRDAPATLPAADREQKHLDLTARVRAMISHSGDNSNLILDPELDSYYLMDTTLLALPQTQDRLAQIMVDGLVRLHTAGAGLAAESARTAVAIDLALLRHADVERINSSTDIALSNGNPDYGPNPHFHEHVPPLLKAYTAANDKLADLLGRLQSRDESGVTEDDLLKTAQAARLASFDLWTASQVELNGLLQRRIDSYVYQRTRSLAVAAGAVLMATLLVTFITKSISGPLKKQAAELRRVNDALSVAHGKLETRVVASDAELQRAEEKYRSIVENSVMGIFQTTPDGRYVSANRALAELYGYPSPEALITGVTDIARTFYVDPDRRRQFVEALAASGAVTHFDAEIIRADGTACWTSMNAREVRDAEGTLLYYEGTVEDITQRKRAELEEARAKRQSEAARVAAEEARVAAEAASTAKSDFLAGMSHEIRTPLNGVIGMIDLMSNTPLNNQQQRYAKVIKTSSDALLTIINQILDFSKIEAGKLELEEHAFDLHFAVEDVVSVLAQKAAAKGLELACRIDPAVPEQVRGDGDRLRQVLMNLLNNAIKFTTTGEVIVDVAPVAGDTPDGTARLKVAVTDTGIGIPADRRDRLFKSFSQVDTSITRQFGGTGLGLAISKQLAELMGGEIGVESTVGKGSTFWFTLLLKPDCAPAAPLSLAGHRVLVVDDSPTQCQLMREQLAAWEVETASAMSAPEAVELMQAAVAAGRPFHAALTDLNMPGMDGLAMAQVVRAMPATKDLPIVLMTGVDRAVDAEGRLFQRQVTKPVRQSQLFDAMMSVLMTPKAEPTAAPVEAAAPATSPAPSPASTTAGLPRILLAEDIEINQFVVTETLARVGYTCDIANNGREAAQMAGRARYDVILMDCQMPEMSGFEAAVAVRRAEQAAGRARVPIVALTANAVKGDRERCLEAGMDEYLTKPLNPAKLIETIRKYTADAVARAPAATPAVVATDATASADAPAAAFDHADLLARCDGDTAMLGRLVQKFQDKSRTMYDQLRAGVAAGDPAETARLAHALKGTASNLSAAAVAGLAARVEELGRAGDLSLAEAAVHELGRELDRCRAAFDGVLAGRGISPPIFVGLQNPA